GRLSDAPRGHVNAIRISDRIGYLPQRLDHLNDDLTILDTVRASAPRIPVEEVRANLARFLFLADTVHRRFGDLSGGDRFRVALATLLLAAPAYELLLLYEPANILNLRSIDVLVSARDAYQGALIVVSHDEAYLTRLHHNTWVELNSLGLTL